MSKPNRVYVASSWRCVDQPVVVEAIRDAGIDVYDFRHPDGADDGFHWVDVMDSYLRVGPGVPEQRADADDYVKALQHPTAIAGFEKDYGAMQSCDAAVLVLPCGRSAHLELGWFVGQGKPTAVLLDGPTVIPELMYRLADVVVTSNLDLLDWLTA